MCLDKFSQHKLGPRGHSGGSGPAPVMATMGQLSECRHGFLSLLSHAAVSFRDLLQGPPLLLKIAGSDWGQGMVGPARISWIWGQGSSSPALHSASRQL